MRCSSLMCTYMYGNGLWQAGQFYLPFNHINTLTTSGLAGAKRLELLAYGFGDRRSTN